MSKFNRCTGESTRLVDYYIQKIFNNPHQPILIKGHLENTNEDKDTFKRVWRRLCFEHRADVRKDLKHNTNLEITYTP